MELLALLNALTSQISRQYYKHARKKFEDWPAILADLSEGRDLDPEITEAALISVLRGEATDAQLAGTVVALRQKGETVDELSGLVRAMRFACIPIKCSPETIDLVGAGGSPLGRKAALNVSTIASFVVAAGAGAKVCKHENRKLHLLQGSFDLLEELSIAGVNTVDQVSLCVEGDRSRLCLCALIPSSDASRKSSTYGIRNPHSL